MSHNNARTPFDDPDNSGVDVPLSKTTQPLPSQSPISTPSPSSVLGGLQSGSYGAPTGNSATPQHAPPQPTYPQQPAYPPQPTAQQTPTYPQQPAYPPQPTYPPQPVAPPTTAMPGAPYGPPPPAPVAPPPAPTGKLKTPIPTLLGLAALAGVVLAIGVPALMRRAIPPVPMKTLPPSADATVAPIVVARPTAVKAPILATPEAAPEEATAPSTSSEADAPREPGVRPGLSVDDGAGAEDSPSPRSEDEGGTKDVDDGSDSGTVTDAAPADEPTKPDEVSGSNPSPKGSASGSARSALGYAIEAPAGWRRTRAGRRTVWTGPGGAQLLVEVASDVTSSPRADWEKLDSAFKKKYGRRYRSRGIRGSTLAGRPAAAWEFELDSPSGRTTRKLDVAVHSKGRGYAVLGSAPAERWDEVSPQILAAIDSFQLKPGDEGKKDSDGDGSPDVPARDEPGF